MVISQNLLKNYIMALTPINSEHARQIQAGLAGRKSGHFFEEVIAKEINQIQYPVEFPNFLNDHVNNGNPARVLLHYIASTFQQQKIERVTALSTGALATSEDGKKWLEVNGVLIKRCKSDIIVTLRFSEHNEKTVGVSTKQCNNLSPTNAQIFFTTARGFASFLTTHGIPISYDAVRTLRQFCGDIGFRPSDDPKHSVNRVTDPRRWFWEETHEPGRIECEKLFSENQDRITRLLLQKAYLEDPFTPDFLLHKTKRATHWNHTEVAIYSIDEIVIHSRHYSGFKLRPYSVRKGSFRDPPGVIHLAPRFGIIQMQRGGQSQHPEQLQFNLEAGYFYKIENRRPQVVGDRACK